jgi:hypothetical protein
MALSFTTAEARTPIHAWLRQISVACVSGSTTPLLGRFTANLLECFRQLGHRVQATPDETTDALLTTARFGEIVNWRQALLFTGRRRFGLRHQPTVFTLLHASPADLEGLLRQLEAMLTRDAPGPDDDRLPGLAPRAQRVLREQARRGGPFLALIRVLQAQAKSIRIVLVVGEDRPLEAYHLDLVGAHPRTSGHDEPSLYRDTALRIVTAVSAREVTEHRIVPDPVARSEWERLGTPAAMRAASRELGARAFFTEMVRIVDLVQVPALDGALARQYSEGCFATWDPRLGALVATVTGSARPVAKGDIGDDDLAVVVGVRPDGQGALIRHVEGAANHPPSSEAFELCRIDLALPAIRLGSGWEAPHTVPVIRSKLHGHRGVAAYDPGHAEYVPLDPASQHYPVSCATDAQAHAVAQAFARSEALRNPGDARPLVFTVLPGHGVVIAEKWVAGNAPFQSVWEAMDRGAVAVASRVPQGPLAYGARADGRMVLQPG